MNFARKKILQVFLPVLPGNIPLFLGLAIAISLGIWFAEAPTSLHLLVVLSLFINVFLYYRISKKKSLVVLCSLAGSFLLGASSSWYQTYKYESFSCFFANKKLTLLANIKDINLYPDKDFQHTVLLETINIKTSEIIFPENKNIVLYCKEKPDVLVGDMVRVYGAWVSETKNDSIKKYLVKEGVCGTIFTNKPYITLLDRPRYNIQRYFWQAKNNLVQRISQKLSSSSFPLFSSIFLGKKQGSFEQSNTIRQSFLLWGISHYLARSGLHLVIFLIIWAMFFMLIPVGWKTKEVLFSLLCFFYYFLSWTSTSFIRAFLVFVLYKICSILNLQTNLLHILSVIAFFVLLFNPAQLFFLDFQLSFVLSCALAWLGQTRLPRNKNLQTIG